MSFTIWPATAEHLRLVKVQPAQLGQSRDVFLQAKFDDELLKLYARAFVLGDEVMAVVGVTPMWDHYCLGWALISERALKYPRDLTCSTLRMIERAKLMLGLGRLEINVDTGHPAALRWALHMGFRLEGIRRRFGLRGEDNYVLARIWP